MANIKHLSLLCILLTIAQAFPRLPIMELQELAKAKFNNTLRGKGGKALLPTVAEQMRDWEEGFDHEGKGCIEHNKVEGYWVQACCIKAESAGWYIEQEGKDRFEAKIAKYAMESLGNQTYMDKQTSRCTGRDVKVCLAWSETPDFEISTELKAFIVEQGIRCNEHHDWMTRLHVIPEKGQVRLNICVGNSPTCQRPDQTYKMPCGQNGMDGRIAQPCPTHLESTASRIDNSALKPHPEWKQLGSSQEEGWVPKASEQKELGLFPGGREGWIAKAFG